MCPHWTCIILSALIISQINEKPQFNFKITQFSVFSIKATSVWRLILNIREKSGIWDVVQEIEKLKKPDIFFSPERVI